MNDHGDPEFFDEIRGGAAKPTGAARGAHTDGDAGNASLHVSGLVDVGYLRTTVQFEGREYVREVDGRWIGSDRSVLQNKPSGHVVDPPPRLWKTHCLAKWDGETIPSRRWFMPDWLPLGQCTGLYGIPGIRKSLFVLQAMIAGALDKAFCGIQLEPGPVLGLFCEDTDEEIARRAECILRLYDADFADLGNCHYTALVGAPLTEFITFTRGGTMSLAPPFLTFREQLGDLKPVLAVLDTAPDFFGGNENARREVHAFIRLLDRLAQEFDCALLFSAHPSRRGIAEGSIDSGSTGWEGKVRARLVLHDPAAEETEDETDNQQAGRRQDDERVLTRAKSNYAAPGAKIELVIRDGAFWPKVIDPATAPLRGPMHDAAVDAKFLELMANVKASGAYVNDSRSVPDRYAPAVFGRHPDRGGFKTTDFTKAMARLMGKGRIRLKTASGRHGHNELEIVDDQRYERYQ